MENKDYEILEIDKGERISKALRRAAIVCNSVSLSLGLALCGVKAFQKKNDSKNTYERTLYINAIAKTDANGETTYCAPAGFILGEDGMCYKTEYVVSKGEKAAPEGFYLDEKTGKCYKNPKGEKVAPEGYWLDKKTGKCWSLESLGLVKSSYVPEEGYHLEPYENDENYSYVVQDGYHLELSEADGSSLKRNYLIKDGYHLEHGSKIVKDEILTLKK